MPGVWVFRNGVARFEDKQPKQSGCSGKKALLHLPTGQPVASHENLQQFLQQLGWERYYEDPALVQFHRRTSVDLISLPADFARVGAAHMNDIVVKNCETFTVVDAAK
ncbi:hypothetical protein HU200_060587 [Digitaria exilis]|uniref:Uncharacterized protein n=1 Tax=Digitaria exilis TaxID=1010633 RepID=A0A835DYQ0_9POAL|nr:hypothetical protein HU200_060587 [Digitaria exilis]CAB3491399.1 unnamed protein product [Digitaria exilis]